MPNVYIEARPKGRPEGSAIEDYVVEDHAGHALTLSRHSRKRSSGLKKMVMRRWWLASGI